MSIGNLTNALGKSCIEDPALGDALLTILPQHPTREELDAVDFVRDLSTYLIAASIERDEGPVTILDVYERPDKNFLNYHKDECPLTCFKGIDLLDHENSAVLDRYVSAAEKAYSILMEQQPCGMFMRSITDMIDLYSLVTAPKAANARDDWPRFRRNYVRNVAPACFYLLPDFVSARSFFRNTTPENLIDLMASGGVTIDDTACSELPLPLKRRIGEYLHIVPGVVFSEDGADVTKSATEFHRMLLTGIRVISGARLV